MFRHLFFAFAAVFLPTISCWASPSAKPSASSKAPAAIQGRDVDGRSVPVNATGHYTVVMYTNPDLEDTSRKVTIALDSYRSHLNFVRVVDLRGGVPPQMRGIVRAQIRKEIVREGARLKKAGVAAVNSPIIPDFNGSTLDALGWDSIYDKVHVVVYDPKGREIKRLADVSDPKAVTRVVAAIL